jgi:hypothetical protein
MLDTSQFTYQVVYLPHKQAFFAMCEQFTHLATLSPSYEQALKDIQQSVLNDVAAAA